MKTTRTLALVLSIIFASVLLFTSIPVHTYADLQETPLQESTNSEVIESAVAEENLSAGEDDPDETLNISRIAGEDETLRDEASKQFLLTNGDHLLISYETAVHYPAADGSWKEIDNTLVKKSGDKEDPAERYETTEGLVHYAFAAEAEGEEEYLVKAARGEASLRFSLEEEKNPVNAELQEKVKTDKKSLPGYLEAEKASAGIRYQEILPGTDLAYTVTGPDLKENLVINEPQETHMNIRSGSILPE